METIKNLFLKHSLFKFKIKIVVPSERKKFIPLFIPLFLLHFIYHYYIIKKKNLF